MTAPRNGYWMHYKGGKYLVVGVAERTEEPGNFDVIYVGADGKTWSRPLDFHQKAWNTPVEGGGARFVFLGVGE